MKAAIALLAYALTGPCAAQWLHEPTPHLPRLPSGKVDLGAPVPRTADGHPDLSGVWLLRLNPGYVANVAADLAPNDVQAWAESLYRERSARLGMDDPGTIGCQPMGPRYITAGGGIALVKIVQAAGLIVLLYEDLTYRQIFMDGRKLPKDPLPDFMGYSVGHWDGDDLVVDSVGFKDATWLDFGGHPHTEALRVTERYQRISLGQMRRTIELTDERTFAKPIVLHADMVLNPDTELLEAVCTETPRDQFSLIGRTAAERDVQIAPEKLAKYVGTYELEQANVFGIKVLDVQLSNGQLYTDFNGKGHVPLEPLSETMFSPRVLGTYEFVVGGDGNAAYVLLHAVEGTYKAVRRKP